MTSTIYEEVLQSGLSQKWISENFPRFITKEEWATSSPDLKVKLQKEWAKISQKVIRDSCKSFSNRLQLVSDTDDGHIER